MRDLARIEATWTKLDYALERDLSGADATETSKILSQQIISDQAYFILCRGHLESRIDSTCRAAVDRRRTHADWQVRRAWDLYNPQEARFSGLSFENRARLVLDGQAGRGSEYAITMKHYGSRNQIAHGDLRTTRIDVSAFVQDCFVIQSALHRAT